MSHARDDLSEEIISRPTKKRRAPNERQRAVRACDECRRLKEKCEGGNPCRRCCHLQRPCEFNMGAQVEKRESVLAYSIEDLVDRARYMECIIRHHFPGLGLDVDSLRRKCTSLSSRMPQVPTPLHSHNTWNGTLHRPLHNDDDDGAVQDSPGIEDESCTLDNVDGTIAHYSGEFSHWNFSMHIKRNIDELAAESNVPVCFVTRCFESANSCESDVLQDLDTVLRLPDFIRVGEADPSSTSINDIVGTLPPRPVATFLTKVFFKHATSFYYYVDRQWIDQTLDKLYACASIPRPRDIIPACAVVMVLAVGSQYVHLEAPKTSTARERSRFDVIGNPTGQNDFELDIGATFYRQVARQLSEIIHAGSLLSVQICLLLGLYSSPIDASGLSYIYLNLAIKLGIQNGMHRKVSRDAFDANTKEVRRRVWWTAYCMERRIGIYHGRPISIVRSDIDADLPLSQPQERDGITPFDASLLLGTINLTAHAEEFLRQISLLRNCRRSEVANILGRLRKYKDDTNQSWPSRRLRTDRGSKSNEPCSGVSRVEMHARLDCCLLEMFIGRPFLLVHRQAWTRGRHAKEAGKSSKAAPQAPPPKTTAQAGRSASPSSWGFLVQDCIAAAQEAIDICHHIQTGGLGLAKSSYLEYSSCRAALLVLIATNICYRTNEYSATLETGLALIREMASAGESARAEISLIETLEAASRRLRVFEPASTTQTSAVVQETQEGYEGFVDWYTRRADKANVHGESSARAGSDTIESTAQEHSAPAPHTSLDSGPMNDIDDSMDFLDMDNSAAFLTSNLGEHVISDSELFGNLLWISD